MEKKSEPDPDPGGGDKPAGESPPKPDLKASLPPATSITKESPSKSKPGTSSSGGGSSTTSSKDELAAAAAAATDADYFTNYVALSLAKAAAAQQQQQQQQALAAQLIASSGYTQAYLAAAAQSGKPMAQILSSVAMLQQVRG